MNKVTVVVPNWNGIEYLRKCLDSLRGQDYGFDLVVVDNGSTDGSMQMVETEYPEACIISFLENTGFCHACNAGMKKAESPYVILLNNDTEVLPGFVENLVRAIETDENIFSVSSQMLQIQDNDRIDDAGDRYTVFGWAYARGKDKPAEQYNKPCDVFAACGGASIYRKSVLEKIGYLDENHFAYMEDIDLGYRARIYGYRNVYEPSAKVIHAGSASSGSRYNEFKTKLAAGNNAYMIFKNMPMLQLLLNLPFLLVGFVVKTFFFTRKGMGILYIKSYLSGIKKAFSKQGRERKVPFLAEHLLNYIKIQFYLCVDTVRMLWQA